MDHLNPDESEQPEVLRVFQSKDEAKICYDKISQVYDLIAHHSEEPVRQAGLEQLNARAGETVLEIGFGTGHGLLALTKATGPAGKVYGIDISDGMLAIAQEKLASLGLTERAELACGDGSKLPYPSEMMDAVFMSFTLELFDTPEIPEVLAECMRVLRPGGRIVVVGMSKEGADGIARHIYEWAHEHFPNLVDCRPIYVRRSIEAAGFLIENVETRTMWLPVEIVRAVKSNQTVLS
jgi:ubiquinone/menaquinone biosynthesis C-methylase UbiE